MSTASASRALTFARSGKDGKTGDYTETRYAVTTSATLAPNLSANTRNPAGWSITRPDESAGTYVWMTSAKIDGATEELLIGWCRPVRITPVDGINGQDGARGPALRGPQYWEDCPGGYQFQSGAAGEQWVDVVIYNGQYYVCKTSHAKFTPDYPGGATDKKYRYWQLGDKVDMVATKVLLAEYAVIKNLGAEAIEMRDADGNVVFEAKDGNVTCQTGTFNNVNVQTGQVAGFEISGNALINKGFNSDSYMIIRNDDESVFMGVGANVLPLSLALHKACGRFENGASNSSGYNYGLIATAKNAANNIAIHLGGGCVSGFALRNQIISGTTTTYIERGVNSVIGIGTGNVNIYLPKLDSCDDGYIVRFQSLKDSGSMRIYTQNCTTPSGNGRAAIICYVDGRYTTVTTAYFDLSAPGYAMELMWVRDLTVTVSGTTYRGCWLQYKMPRDW